MAKKTIKLKKYNDIVNEFVAASAITPGSLVELTSAGLVQDHSTDGGDAAVMVALEDELQGKTIEEDYSADDQVQVWHVTPGEEVLAVIPSGEDPAIGTLLESAGDGTFTGTGSGPKLLKVIGAKQIDDDSNHRVPAVRL